MSEKLINSIEYSIGDLVVIPDKEYKNKYGYPLIASVFAVHPWLFEPDIDFVAFDPNYVGLKYISSSKVTPLFIQRDSIFISKKSSTKVPRKITQITYNEKQHHKKYGLIFKLAPVVEDAGFSVIIEYLDLIRDYEIQQ